MLEEIALICRKIIASTFITDTVTITSHSALLPTVLNSKQVFKGQIIPLGMAFNNVSLFDACSVFTRGEGRITNFQQIMKMGAL